MTDVDAMVEAAVRLVTTPSGVNNYSWAFDAINLAAILDAGEQIADENPLTRRIWNAATAKLREGTG